MTIRALPDAWEPTRATLQRYAHALTALPRAGAVADPRWGHVAMDPTPNGFTTAPTPLADGIRLTAVLDLAEHAIVVAAGDETRTFDMTAGPSPKDVGDAIEGIAKAHGSHFDVDAERYADDTAQIYDPAHAAAFLEVARSVLAALIEINAGITGEVTGPHLWPHGFDIATEWYSPKLVDYDGSQANAQIAIGWYPAGDAYVYANPWPFDESFLDADLPDGATWNTEGWYGAMVPVASLQPSTAHEVVVGLGRGVHEAAGDLLSA